MLKGDFFGNSGNPASCRVGDFPEFAKDSLSSALSRLQGHREINGEDRSLGRQSLSRSLACIFDPSSREIPCDILIDEEAIVNFPRACGREGGMSPSEIPEIRRRTASAILRSIRGAPYPALRHSQVIERGRGQDGSPGGTGRP